MMVLLSRAAAKDLKKFDPPVYQKALDALNTWKPTLWQDIAFKGVLTGCGHSVFMRQA